MSTKSNATAYVRPSSGIGIEAQSAAINAFAKESDLLLTVRVEEREDQRTTWEDLKRNATTGLTKIIIVSKLDRIDAEFDDLEEFICFLRDLSMAGCRFISVEDHIDTADSAATLAENLVQAVNSFKVALKSERLHRSLTLAKQQGRHVGRPKERDDVAIQKLRRDGKSIRQIASSLGISVWAVQSALKNHDSESEVAQ